MDENLLEKYMYMGVSFSTFKFLPVDELCLKYELAHLKFFKNRILKEIHGELIKSPYLKDLELEFTSYFVHKETDAIKNATLFVNINEYQEKLVKKFLKKDIEKCDAFALSELPENLVNKYGTFVFTSGKEVHQYMDIIERFDHSNIIILDDVILDEKGEVIKEDLMDLMKLQILKDDADYYFVTSSSCYTNQIINFLFSLNKMGICL